MKQRIEKLETNYNDLDKSVERHESEITLLRTAKHETNGQLQTHNGKFSILEGQQKAILDELILIRLDLKEWIQKTNALINWKFMLVGGACVGTTMISGVVVLFSLYLKYMHD